MSTVIFILVIGGIVGGFVNYFLSTESNPPSADIDHFHFLARSLMLGVAASFVVPLFLNIGQSNLITSIYTDKGQLAIDNALVLLGFSLIAAIFSKQFLQNLSEKVMQRAEEASRQANNAAASVQNLAADLEDDSGENEQPAEPAPAEQINPEQSEVLKSFLAKPLIRRSVTAISKEVGLNKNNTVEILDQLISKKYVEEVDSVAKPGQKRYKSTPLGRQAARQDNADSNDA